MKEKIDGVPHISEVLSTPAKVRTVIASLMAKNDIALRKAKLDSEDRLSPLEVRKRELQELLTIMRGQTKSVPPVVHHSLSRILQEKQ